MSSLLEEAKEIANMIVKQVKEVDLIFLYGGVAQGRESNYSDIDIVVISDEKKIVWEYVIDTRPFMVWSMNWDRAQKIADGTNFFWGIAAATIANNKILYTKSKKIQERFEMIQKTVVEGGKRNLEQTIKEFDLIYGVLWRLKKAIEKNHKIDAAFLISDIANWITHTLACLNNKYMLNNWGKQLNEVASFEILPNEFIKRYEELVNASPEEALGIASDLVDDVNLLLREYLRENETVSNEDIEEIATEWPGIIEYCNKAISAAEKNDINAGLYAAIDNAEYYLWAFNLLQNRKWKRNSFYSSSEEIVKFSANVAENITKLALNKNIIELKDTTEELVNVLYEELKLRGLKVPVATSHQDALQFLQINDLKK